MLFITVVQGTYLFLREASSSSIPAVPTVGYMHSYWVGHVARYHTTMNTVMLL